MGRSLRRAAVAVGASLVLASTAVAALAHTGVRSTSPADGSVLTKPPATVSVTFQGQILSGSITVRKGGKVVSTGPNGIDPRNVARLRVKLERGLGTGVYSVAWEAKAPDGHHQTGSFRFRVGKK